MSKSLQNQWLSVFFAVSLLIVLVITGAAWFIASRQTRAQVETRLNDVAEELSRSNYPLNAKILETIASLTAADLVLLDPFGKIILTASNSKAPLSQIAIPQAVLQSDKSTIREPIAVPGRGVYFSEWIRFQTSEVRTPQGTAKCIGILISDDSIRQMQRQAFVLPMLTGCSTAFALGLVACLLNAKVVKRLQVLQQHVGRIAQGKFDPIPLQNSNDELGQLARSVNAMAADLRLMEGKIHVAERDRLVRQTADGLAHDLRNTLTGARLALQLHGKTCNSGDREAIAVATRQLSLAEDQIQRWLRDEHQTDANSVSPFGIAVEGAIQLAQPTAEHLQVRLEFIRDAMAENHEILDLACVQSAVLNLLMNAIQAAGIGGTVRLETYGISGSIGIRVTDTGPGPPEELESRIFEPFVTSKREGVGMGLALVDRTAKKLGGTVNWERIDRQTIFTFQMPSRPKS